MGATALEMLVHTSTFCEGIMDVIVPLPAFLILKDDFGLNPTQLSLTLGAAQLPWMLKPGFLLLNDYCPVLGRRRTPYLGASAVFVLLALVGLQHTSGFPSMLAYMALQTLGRCLLDASLTGLRVELARPRGQDGSSKAVGDVYLIKGVGSILGSTAVSAALSHLTPRPLFGLACGVPLVVVIATLAHDLQRSATTPALAESPGVSPQLNLEDLGECTKDPAIWAPLVFLFTFAAGPSYEESLYYYYINSMRFDPVFLAHLQTVHAVARTGGIAVYRFWLRHVPDRVLLSGLCLVSLPLYLSPLMLTTGAHVHLRGDPRLIALSGEMLREVFNHMQVMPVVTRLVNTCPVGLESSIVSLPFATTQLARATSRLTTAGATALLGVTPHNFTNLSTLIMISGSCLMVPLAVVGQIPKGELMPGPESPREEPGAATEPSSPGNEDDPFLLDGTGGV